MKNIYIIQNSNLSFDMDISKIYSPKKYNLFLIINKFGLEKLNNRKQNSYFNNIWITDNFSFDYLQNIISTNQIGNNLPLQMVTNSEETVAVCGKLRVYFDNDMHDYDRFINKLIMKEKINTQSLLIPKHISLDKHLYKKNTTEYITSISNKLTFPLIVKPIDSLSCIGIKKLDTLNDLTIWINNAILTDKEYEIDEYIDGKVYNCDSYIKNKKIVFTQVSECSNSCYDFICGLTKGTIALPNNNSVYTRLSKYTA